LRLNVNKTGFYVDLYIFGDWRKQCFGASNFTVLSVIGLPGQSHSCCPKQAFLKDLPSQKLLIVNVGATRWPPRGSRLNRSSGLLGSRVGFISKAKP